jgi:O-acetyl-ADP-ribose deacetylase (regulator of RNase III)
MAAASTEHFEPPPAQNCRARCGSATPPERRVATNAYALPARWVIHAVGPVWGFGGQEKLDLLTSAYRSALHVAEELGAKSVSMPPISAGTFGFPIDATADVALRTVRDHLLGETQIERVTFVLRGDAVQAFGRRLRTI